MLTQLRLQPMLQLARKLHSLILNPHLCNKQCKAKHRKWQDLMWSVTYGTKSTKYFNFRSANFCRIRNTRISITEMLFARIKQNCDNKSNRQNISVGIVFRLWAGQPVQICSIPVRRKSLSITHIRTVKNINSSLCTP
jgi:hypothetical protein